MPSCEAIDAMEAWLAAGVRARTVVLDPWYRERNGQGRAAYLTELLPLLDRAARLADHVYVWGFPESVARLVDQWPERLELHAWLTWHYRNAQNRGRSWRPAQQACLHLCRRGATTYPEHFWSSRQRDLADSGRLVHKPTPYSVLSGPLLAGFIDRAQQSGYVSQKPRVVIEPLLKMTCKPGDLVLDPTAGSGTTGEVAASLGCRAILSDRSPRAIRITRKRLAKKGFYFDGADFNTEQVRA